jgi:hypothetical protein
MHELAGRRAKARLHQRLQQLRKRLHGPDLHRRVRHRRRRRPASAVRRHGAQVPPGAGAVPPHRREEQARRLVGVRLRGARRIPPEKNLSFSLVDFAAHPRWLGGFVAAGLPGAWNFCPFLPFFGGCCWLVWGDFGSRVISRAELGVVRLSFRVV